VAGFRAGGKYFESHVPAGIGPFVVLLGQVRGSSLELGSRAVTTWACWARTEAASGCSKMVRSRTGPPDTRSAAALRVSVISSALVYSPAVPVDHSAAPDEL
jgi:hypothetical protein